MKSIKTFNKPSKKLWVVTALIILVVVASVLFIYFNNKNNTDTSQPAARAQSDIEQKAQLEERPENKNLAPNSDQPSAPTSNDSSGKKNVQMIVSASISGNTLYIRGGLNYPVPEEGSCFAVITSSSGETTRKDMETLQNPASTDCKTLSLPISELSPGKWSVILKYTSETYEGTSNEAIFTIN